jgi:hypothetical protein
VGDLGVASLRVVEHMCYGESNCIAHNYKMGGGGGGGNYRSDTTFTELIMMDLNLVAAED